MRYVTVDLSRISRDEEMFSLAGPFGEGEVEGPYAQVERELTEALARLRELRAHAHMWHDDGFCVLCGADGNA